MIQHGWWDMPRAIICHAARPAPLLSMRHRHVVKISSVARHRANQWRSCTPQRAAIARPEGQMRALAMIPAKDDLSDIVRMCLLQQHQHIEDANTHAPSFGHREGGSHSHWSSYSRVFFLTGAVPPVFNKYVGVAVPVVN